jgi:OOP family OmpA-OmpF porin
MKKALFALLAASCAIPAIAGDIYGGASIARAGQKVSESGLTLSENSTGFKVFGGYQFTPMIGAEAGYVDFGKATISADGASLSAKPQSFYAAVTGSVPVTGQLSAFAKLGVASNRTTVSATMDGQTDSEKFRQTSAMFAVGASYAVNARLSIVAEYENFGKVLKEEGSTLKVDALSIGVRYKF